MWTYVTSGRLREVKSEKENCKLSSLKVVAVAYERWSLTRGSSYSDLTGKILLFWKSSRLREVIARFDCIYSATFAERFINDYASEFQRACDQKRVTLGTKKIAFWRKKLNFSNPASNNDKDNCISCFDSTKYGRNMD